MNKAFRLLLNNLDKFDKTHDMQLVDSRGISSHYCSLSTAMNAVINKTCVRKSKTFFSGFNKGAKYLTEEDIYPQLEVELQLTKFMDIYGVQGYYLTINTKKLWDSLCEVAKTRLHKSEYDSYAPTMPGKLYSHDFAFYCVNGLAYTEVPDPMTRIIFRVAEASKELKLHDFMGESTGRNGYSLGSSVKDIFNTVMREKCISKVEGKYYIGSVEMFESLPVSFTERNMRKAVPYPAKNGTQNKTLIYSRLYTFGHLMSQGLVPDVELNGGMEYALLDEEDFLPNKYGHEGYKYELSQYDEVLQKYVKVKVIPEHNILS